MIFFINLKITCVVSLATMPTWGSSLSSWPSPSPTPSSSDWRERRPWHFEWWGCNFGGKGHLCKNMYYIRNFNQKIDNRYYIKWVTVLMQYAYIYLHNPFWATRECLPFLNEIPFLSAISLRVWYLWKYCQWLVSSSITSANNKTGTSIALKEALPAT